MPLKERSPWPGRFLICFPHHAKFDSRMARLCGSFGRIPRAARALVNSGVSGGETRNPGDLADKVATLIGRTGTFPNAASTQRRADGFQHRDAKDCERRAGERVTMNEQHRNALPAGYRLENFRCESVLGHGGFGITYRAVDEDLQQVVAIKEYLPREVALRDRDFTVVPVSESDRETLEWGLERFLDEARTLARFRHPNIVGVRRFLRANGTAYLVMDYCEGESLESMLAQEGTLAPERLEAMLKPLLDTLEMLHDAGVTHRDIKPGNIYLREDGSPVLLDFGAARQALAQHSRSVTAMATPGYAAFEQYSTKGKQGPWTDIYGLGATLYRCVTGQRPPDASDRMLEDDLIPATEGAKGCYSLSLLERIDAALSLKPTDRPQGIRAWRIGTTPIADKSITDDSRARTASPWGAGKILRERLQGGLEGPEMVFLRGGSFAMGSPSSEVGLNAGEREHEVTVSDFWIGRYLVTFEEYDHFAGLSGRSLPDDRGWGRGSQPVILVSWYDAVAYAEWVSGQTGRRYRLATEAEWEYAARAGTTDLRYWGDPIGQNLANCHGCGSQWDGKQPSPVGSFMPNPWGVYDMLGNVWEWTGSTFDRGYTGGELLLASTSERGSRIVRGGSFAHDPVQVRCATRGWESPEERLSFIGFRLARSA